MKEMPTPRQETKRRRIAPSETAARYAGRAQSTTNVRNRTKRSLRAVRKRGALARSGSLQSARPRDLQHARRLPRLRAHDRAFRYIFRLYSRATEVLHTRGSALVGS